MKEQKKLGRNNFIRGILSKKWGEIQLKHSLRKRKMKGTIGQVDRWSEEVIQALLTFSTNMWKTRCEIIHLLGKGTEDDTTRTQILNRWFRLNKEPWMLTPMDRHLLSKNEDFFRRARITNVRAWNERVKIALKWSEESANFLGEDLCRYYPTITRQKTKGKRKRSRKVKRIAHEVRLHEEATSSPLPNHLIALRNVFLDSRKVNVLSRTQLDYIRTVSTRNLRMARLSPLNNSPPPCFHVRQVDIKFPPM